MSRRLSHLSDSPPVRDSVHGRSFRTLCNNFIIPAPGRFVDASPTCARCAAVAAAKRGAR